MGSANSVAPIILSPAVTPIHETLKQFSESKRHNLQQDAFRKRQSEIERQVQEITEQRRIADIKLQQQLAEQEQKKQQREQERIEEEKSLVENKEQEKLERVELQKQKMREMVERQKSDGMETECSTMAVTRREPGGVGGAGCSISPCPTSVRGLKPYRPLGGTDVYYVESTTDDTMSITTVESTHAGM